ncbi:MAG TPA: 3-oxo-tetronate 4-phosphate decarboxylase [Bradyrhizobium sp.]|nr:3-oxo-tetronate 4-phosphate decarboxylase [Bradyrhizobium sp.]
MTEEHTRQAIVRWGRSLFERGLTAGSSGNISVRHDDFYLMTPTNSCLGFLDPARLAKLSLDGGLISGDPPTKELPLHISFYEARQSARAVVHLHSTYATALSCLSDTNPDNAVPPITPYVVMRVGRVPVIPYTRPGSADVSIHIRAKASNHAAILLGNHGPVVAGSSLEVAIFAIEELEETAKLVLLTRGLAVRRLDQEQIQDLNADFNLR